MVMSVNMGTVRDRTTEFLGDHFRALFPIALLAIFVPQAVGDVLQLSADSIGQGMVQVIGLLLVLVTLWGQLAIVAFGLNPDAGRAAAQSEATRGYGRAVLVMILVFIAIMVLLIPIFGVLAASGVDLTQLAGGQAQASAPDISPGAGAFIGLYVLVFLIVVAFVSARLVALYPAVLAERRGINAIGRSFAITRGLTWKLIGVLVLFMIVFAVSAIAARSVFGVIVGLIFPAQGTLTPATVTGAIFGALVSTAFSLIISAFSAKLYRAVVPASAGAALSA